MNRRIEFEFTEEAGERLEKLKEKASLPDYGALFREALRLYEFAVENRLKGWQIGAFKDGRAVAIKFNDPAEAGIQVLSELNDVIQNIKEGEKETGGVPSALVGAAEVLVRMRRLGRSPEKPMSGDEVRIWRESLGMSQLEFAEYFGLTVEDIQYWEMHGYVPN